MRNPSRRNSHIALAAILACPLGLAASDPIPIESAVAFNTQCARCHEGECSGRLSFHLGEDAADEHIRRHGGALPLETVRDLNELLRYMKVQCAFYPLPLTLGRDRVWGGDTLGHLRAPDGTAYFLPLGLLAPGPHRLWIDGLDAGTKACAELVAASFDQVDHQGMVPAGERRVLAFQVDAPTELYVRITAQGPITLTRVELASVADGASSPALEP
jgi:hypothetical protein